MPKVPKWMANAMERLFSGSYHPVVVTEIKDINSKLRQIRFEGDFTNIKTKFTPGNVIEFRINDTEFRHYTPRRFEHGTGICDVLFYLHDKGPGSKWITNLKVGDNQKLMGPGGKMSFNHDAKHHIFFGDETSLGFLQCMIDEAKKNNRTFHAIAELNSMHLSWTETLDKNIHGLKTDIENHGQPTCLYLKQIIESNDYDLANTTFYLTGNALSIKNILSMLKQLGISRKQIQSEPYWVEHKSGL